MATRRVNFYDPENDTLTELLISEEDALRCENDIEFATRLMHSVLNENKDHSEKQENSDLEKSECINSEEQGDGASSEDTGLCRWSTEMVLLLLDSYIEVEEKFNTGKFSQKKIWEDIAKSIQSRYPQITGPHCAAKLRSLKKTYRNVKDHNNKSGNNPRTWIFFEKMDQIFCKKAWASPVAVASSSGAGSSSQSESGVSSKPSSSRKPNSVATLLKRRLDQKSQEEEARAKRHKEKMDMDQKLLEVLTKLADKN